MSLPSLFFKYQTVIGHKSIRMRDTQYLVSSNIYSGKIFVLRNEPWEPYLNHASRIAQYFSIDLKFEISNYDNSLLLFPENKNAPVIIWVNWNRIKDKELYINEMDRFQTFKNKIYIVVPKFSTDKLNYLQRYIKEKLPWVEIIEPSSNISNIEDEELGYSKDQIIEIASSIGQELVPQHFYPKIKAIISDLDNTMYLGVLGEDQLKNLKVTDQHLKYQTKLKELSRNGILLNIVSKNNREETDLLFEFTETLIIPKEMFTYIIVNWESKVLGIKEILQQLNIDEESVVFLDDNPRELIEVGLTYPRMLLINALDTHNLNQILSLKFISNIELSLIPSHQRSSDLKANTQRRLLIGQSENSIKILKEMNTKINSGMAESENHFLRADELFNKTNQFNFSNRRTKLEVLRFEMQKKIVISSISDDFSDSGIVGAMLFTSLPNKNLQISELVISCRALGRSVEKYIVWSMLDVLRASSIIEPNSQIFVEFIETSRNVPAKLFLTEWFFHVEGQIYQLRPEFFQKADNTFGQS